MSAGRYMPAVELLASATPRWWRQGDRTLERMEREQRREAWRRHTDDPQRLTEAMQRRLGGER